MKKIYAVIDTNVNFVVTPAEIIEIIEKNKDL